MDGAAIYLWGAGWGGRPFSSPTQAHIALTRVSRTDEPTSTALALLEPGVVDALSGRRSQAATDAVNAFRWQQALISVPGSAQRIALALRFVERLLPPAAARHPAEKWRGAARRYLRDRWAEGALLQTLYEVAEAGIGALPGRFMTTENERRVQRFRGLMLPSIQGSRFVVRGDNIIRHASELAIHLPEGSLTRRRVDEVSRRLAAGPDAVAWLDEFASTFDRLLDRSSRERNAVLHGADTVPAVLETVEPFVADLGRMLAAEQLDCAANGTDLLESLEYARLRALQRREQLENGAVPADVLFENQED